MNKQTRKRDPDDMRARILAAAFELFNSRLYNDLNSNDIARHAQVSVGSFYNHFETKQDVFIACYDQWVDKEWAAIRQWLESPASRRTSKRLITLLRTQHETARLFRRNLAVVCALSDDVQAHRDRRLAAQRKELATVLGHPSASSGQSVSLMCLLNSFAFLLDVLANDRQTNLGLGKKDTLNHLTQLIDALDTGS